MTEMTWQDVDRLEAERKQKIRDCVERLAKVLAREFDFEEIRLIQYGGDAILIEAFEIARTKARK